MIWIAGLATGVISGLGTAGLLYILQFVTEARGAHPWLIYGLAPAGLLTGVVYRSIGRSSAAGTELILEEIHAPKNGLPLRMAPLILFSTALTHLVGGSAGREGSAVQMGAAFAERLARTLGLDRSARRALLAAGMSAGFAGAIGAPCAGALFGLEVLGRGKWRSKAIGPCLVAAVTAVYVTHILRAPHGAYGTTEIDLFSPGLWPMSLAVGLLSGVTARAFVMATHAVRDGLRARVAPRWRSFLAGLILVVIFDGLELGRYAGLGISVISEALTRSTTFADPLLKLLVTAGTIGGGFKGGEFIPLVFIGTTIGASLSALVPGLPLAALGFGAVFGAAANTPFACAIMAAELFGWRLLAPALITCYAAYTISGHPGIYANQPRSSLKVRWPKKLGSSRNLQ